MQYLYGIQCYEINIHVCGLVSTIETIIFKNTTTLFSFRNMFWCFKHHHQPLWIYSKHLQIKVVDNYYMASSMSGKMNQIVRCDWLPERARWSHLARSGLPAVSQAKFHQKPYNKSFIDQVCSVKMAGYWPRSFFASLWTSTSSQSINSQKENLANIQPSWPHTWSITHTYTMKLYKFK